METPFTQVLQLFDLPGSDEELEGDEPEERAPKIGKDAEQSRDLGDKSMVAGEYSEAVDHFKRAIAQGRRGTEALFDVGAAYESADLLPQAYYQYRKALRQTSSTDLHVGMAALFRKFGRMTDASKELQKAIETQPDAAYLRFKLAEVLRTNGFLTAAAEALAGAIALAPEDPFYHYWNADLLVDAGRFEEATRASQAAVELNPADEHVMLLAALALWGAGKKDEGIRAAHLAGELVTNDSRIAVVVQYHLLLAAGKDLEAEGIRLSVENADRYDVESALRLLKRVGLDQERQPYMR